jgi:type IV pilus modification protein PilV
MKNPARMQGFAFVELLVSVVIIGFGLLAISALQTNALQATRTAYLRAAASEFAVAYSERIRTNTADTLYVYNEDNNIYTLSSAVACYLASGSSLANAGTMCGGATAGQQSTAASDAADMNQWLQGASAVLPQASWTLNLLQQNGAVASNIAAGSCNFSLASGGVSQPCSLQLTVSWQEARASAPAASISYIFR